MGSFVVRVVRVGLGHLVALLAALTHAELGERRGSVGTIMYAHAALFAFGGAHELFFEVNCAARATISCAVASLIPTVRFRPRLRRNTKVAVAALDECADGMSAERASFHDGSTPLPGLDALAKIEALRNDLLVESRQAEVQLLLNGQRRSVMNRNYC